MNENFTYSVFMICVASFLMFALHCCDKDLARDAVYKSECIKTGRSLAECGGYTAPLVKVH